MELQLIDPVMEEIWAIQREISLKRLSQTDEENRRDGEEAIRRFEEAIGRKIPRVKCSSEVFNSRLPPETTEQALV